MVKIIRIIFLSLLALILTACTEITLTKKETLLPVFEIKGELPDIGEFGSGTKARFYNEFTPDFVPSDEYGMIIPYVGNYKVYSTNDDNFSINQGYASYGFCTPDGRIVMDASSKTSYIYYRETYDGFGYYSVSRDIQQREDAPDEYYSEETLVIPASGKWCITLGERAWVSQAGGGILVICKYYVNENNYEDAVIELYDYDGNKISGFSGYDSFGVYSHGLMSASKWDDEEGYSVSFINLDGEVILGPYSSAGNFYGDGITHVKDFYGESYLIDIYGNRLTDGDYSGISVEYIDDNNVVFIARCNNNQGTDILDQDGNILGHIDTNKYISLSFLENGEILYYYSDYSNGNYNDMVWKRLSDGSDFTSREFGVSPNEYPYDDGIYVHENEEDGKAIIFDGNGETVAVIEDWNGVSRVSDNGKYFAYSTGEYDYEAQVPVPISEIHLRIYDIEKQEDVVVVEADGHISFVGKENQYALVSAYEEFSIFGGYDSYHLYDIKTGEALFENCRYIGSSTICGNTYLQVCTENSYTLYDDGMNIILRVYGE